MPAIIAIAQILVTIRLAFGQQLSAMIPAANHLILNSADFSVNATELKRNSANQCGGDANLGPNLWVFNKNPGC